MNQPDEDDSPPLASICDAQLQPSTVSILTEPPDVVPLTTLPRSSPCSIGQPQPPPLPSANNAIGGADGGRIRY